MMPIRQCRNLFCLFLRLCCALAICLSPGTGPSFALAAKLQDKMVLSPRLKLEREIRGGEVHTYSLALAAGEFVRLVVEVPAGALVLALCDADGKTLAAVDTVINYSAQKRLSFVSQQAGDYQLTVRPSGKDAAIASYYIEVDEWRRGEAKDANAVAAERLLAEGQVLDLEGTAESRRKAMQKYEASLPLWQAAGDRRGEAEALSRLSDVAHQVSDNQKALERSEQALLLWRAVGDRAGEASTLNVLGLARWALSDYQKALADFDRALSLRRDMGDRRGEASTLYSIGIIYATLGENQESLKRYNQALLLWREMKDRVGEARTLTNIGVIYTAMAEYQKALECYERALPLHAATKNRSGEGYTLNNMGDVYFGVGEYQKALEYYEQALPFSRETGDRWGQANTLNHMGNVYDALGDYQKALTHYNLALTLHREIKELRGEANSLGDMAAVYQKLGEYQKASGYHDQTLSIRRAIGDRIGEIVSLNNLGLISAALGDSQRALDYYDQAFTLGRALQLPYISAQSLQGMARVERNLGNLAAALTRIETALEIVESLRAKLAAQELRASFLASVRELYELKIDLLIRLDEREPAAGHAAAALVVSERSRARSLLETLAEVGAAIRQGVAPDLLERERSLQRQINDSAASLTRLLGGKHTEEQATAAQKELDALLTAYQQLQAQIRTASPRYAALTQPQPLSVKEIQQQVLDPDTLLLEYTLGEERSFLWAVSPTSIKCFALPGRAEVEAAARRLYALVSAGHQHATDETPAQHQVQVRKSEAEYVQAANGLSRLLLGPVASQLETKRLVIVSEGALQYVPFGALPVPQAPGSDSSRRGGEFTPLLVEHEIVIAPSASVLQVLRKELAGRQPAPKSVAVFADPVFAIDDPRMNPARAGVEKSGSKSSPAATDQPDTAADAERSAKDVGLNHFVRLRFSRQEAEAISAFAPEKERLTALDFVASHETAERADLSQYRIIHFATHGLLNSRQPELSGIVLSLVDEQGRAQDGFLRVHEIYNLKLGAELVVLSACQTALGREVRGEGLIGLTRGFMYAGAARVVASLWRLDDRATAQLMKRFYQGMLKDGLRPAAALRAAQVSMLKEKQWRAPHYWAAFTIQGEWR